MTRHVAVLMGGWSAEREVSLRSGKACADALERLGHRVTRIDVGRDIAAVLVAGIVFFICGTIGQNLVKPHHLHEPAFKIDTAEAPAAAGAKTEELTPIAPLMAAADAKPTADMTIVVRDDGSKMWAYKGKPLYTFKKDTKRGDTTGDGFLNGAWHMAKP